MLYYKDESRECDKPYTPPNRGLTPSPKEDATAVFIFLLKARLWELIPTEAREVPGSAVTNPYFPEDLVVW